MIFMMAFLFSNNYLIKRQLHLIISDKTLINQTSLQLN
jgi:hypothetical protein